MHAPGGSQTPYLGWGPNPAGGFVMQQLVPSQIVLDMAGTPDPPSLQAPSASSSSACPNCLKWPRSWGRPLSPALRPRTETRTRCVSYPACHPTYSVVLLSQPLYRIHYLRFHFTLNLYSFFTSELSTFNSLRQIRVCGRFYK